MVDKRHGQVLQVLSCHQPQWRPTITRTLVSMWHQGGEMLPSNMPANWYQIIYGIDLLIREKHVLYSNTEVCLMTPETAIWVRLSGRNPDNISKSASWMRTSLPHSSGQGSPSHWRWYNKWTIAPTRHYNGIFQFKLWSPSYKALVIFGEYSIFFQCNICSSAN